MESTSRPQATFLKSLWDGQASAPSPGSSPGFGVRRPTGAKGSRGSQGLEGYRSFSGRCAHPLYYTQAGVVGNFRSLQGQELDHRFFVVVLHSLTGRRSAHMG